MAELDLKDLRNCQVWGYGGIDSSLKVLTCKKDLQNFQLCHPSMFLDLHTWNYLSVEFDPFNKSQITLRN